MGPAPASPGAPAKSRAREGRGRGGRKVPPGGVGRALPGCDPSRLHRALQRPRGCEHPQGCRDKGKVARRVTSLTGSATLHVLSRSCSGKRTRTSGGSYFKVTSYGKLFLTTAPLGKTPSSHDHRRASLFLQAPAQPQVDHCFRDYLTGSPTGTRGQRRSQSQEFPGTWCSALCLVGVQ